MSHKQVACVPLLQRGVLVKHSLAEFALCFRTTRVMSGGGWSRGVTGWMRITSDSVGVPLPSSPSPFLCPLQLSEAQPAASSVPSTGSTLTQLDARHELNS